MKEQEKDQVFAPPAENSAQTEQAPSSPTYTPGPWQHATTGSIMTSEYSQPFAVAQVGKANLIAGCFGDVAGGIEVAEANARLISAAPDMLAKLKKIVAWLTRLEQRCLEHSKDMRFPSLAEANAADAKNYRATIEDIRAVLRAAEGHPLSRANSGKPNASPVGGKAKRSRSHKD